MKYLKTFENFTSDESPFSITNNIISVDSKKLTKLLSKFGLSVTNIRSEKSNSPQDPEAHDLYVNFNSDRFQGELSPEIIKNVIVELSQFNEVDSAFLDTQKYNIRISLVDGEIDLK